MYIYDVGVRWLLRLFVFANTFRIPSFVRGVTARGPNLYFATTANPEIDTAACCFVPYEPRVIYDIYPCLVPKNRNRGLRPYPVFECSDTQALKNHQPQRVTMNKLSEAPYSKVMWCYIYRCGGLFTHYTSIERHLPYARARSLSTILLIYLGEVYVL